MGEKIKTHVNDNEYADSSRYRTIAEPFISYLLIMFSLLFGKKDKAHEISFVLD